jgi:threonine dehydratase
VVAAGVRPELQVIGVQSEAAPAAYRSWKERRIVHDSTSTFAEGLATRVGFELPQLILQERLADFVLVSEQAIREAMLSMIEATSNLVEASGAAPLAAALELGSGLRGRKVGLVCSGGNVSPEQLRALLTSTT